MIKFLALLATTAIVLGVWSGVLQVSWHPEHLSQIPNQLGSFAENSNLGEQAYYYAIHYKRQAEQAMMHDPKKELRLAITYVKQDATRLTDLVASQKAFDRFVPQTKLLAESVRLLQQQKSQATTEEILATSDSSGEVIRDASIIVHQLQDKSPEFKNTTPDLAATTNELASLLNVNQSPINTKGTVAGVEDKNPTATPVPKK